MKGAEGWSKRGAVCIQSLGDFAQLFLKQRGKKIKLYLKLKSGFTAVLAQLYKAKKAELCRFHRMSSLWKCTPRIRSVGVRTFVYGLCTKCDTLEKT